MLKITLLNIIKFYQTFLSPLKPKVCRYYPSCSEYAFLQISQNSIFKALFHSLFRILKCNPFCKGGFDHPKIFKKFQNPSQKLKLKLKFIYVPCGKDKFYLIKIKF